VSGFAEFSEKRRRAAHFDGVRERPPAFSTADSSAVGVTPRRVAPSERDDESPHSEIRYSPQPSGVVRSHIGKPAIADAGARPIMDGNSRLRRYP
jgi:hypothetical protein